MEDDRLAPDLAGAVVEHEREEHVVGLGLDPPRPARLDESAEQRQRRAAVGGQDVELADHVLRLALVAHDEPVSRRPAVQPEQEQVAEAPAAAGSRGRSGSSSPAGRAPAGAGPRPAAPARPRSASKPPCSDCLFVWTLAQRIPGRPETGKAEWCGFASLRQASRRPAPIQRQGHVAHADRSHGDPGHPGESPETVRPGRGGSPGIGQHHRRPGPQHPEPESRPPRSWAFIHSSDRRSRSCDWPQPMHCRVASRRIPESFGNLQALADLERIPSTAGSSRRGTAGSGHVRLIDAGHGHRMTGRRTTRIARRPSAVEPSPTPGM